MWPGTPLTLPILLSVICLFAPREAHAAWRHAPQVPGRRPPEAAPRGTRAPAGTAARSDDSYAASGTIESRFNVKIAARTTGRILYLQVREGDRVTKGQLLVKIDPSDVAGQVRLAKAALAAARSRLAQAEALQNPAQVTVEQQVKDRQAALASAEVEQRQTLIITEAQIAAAKANLEDVQQRVEAASATIKGALAAIQSAESNREHARSRRNRIVELFKQGFSSQQEVDDAETAVNVRQAALDAAKSQLRSTEAARDSLLAQLTAAQKQQTIVANTVKADREAVNAKTHQARAALDYARANRSQTPAYRRNLQALRSAVRAAKSALESSGARLADTLLRSPLDGYITGRFADPGATATPGLPLLNVQSIQQVWATIPFPERLRSQFRIGLPARVTLDALPGKAFVGRIVQINPAADTASREFQVRIALKNPGNLIRPGMFARAALVHTPQRKSKT